MIHLSNASIISYNGQNLTTNYKAIIPPDAPISQTVSINEVKRLEAAPIYSGKIFNSRNIPVRIGVLANGTGTVEELKSLFDVSDTSLHQLIITDSSTGLSWYVDATPAQPPVVDAGLALFETSLYAPDAIWRAVTGSASYWGITGSGSSIVITTSGDKEAFPIFSFTPISLPNGSFGWQDHISIYNPTDKTINLRPVDLMNANWNTQGLVTGSVLRSDGADVDVMVDGQLANFWLGNYNTTKTRLWTNLHFEPGLSFILATGTSIASGTALPAYIQVAPYTPPTTSTPEALEDPLDLLPPKGCIRVDNEEFLYTRINSDTRKFTISARAARGTSANAHAAGATVIWIEHEIIVLYGNPGAVARAVSNTRKPVFDLATSTNAEKYYPYPSTALGFGDEDRLEAGSFKLSVQRSIGKKSEYYGGISGTYATPFNVIGLHMTPWKIGGRYQAEDATIEGRIVDPAGIAYVSASGTKRLSRTTEWPDTAGLQSSYGTTWIDEAAVSAPTVSGTWQGWNMALNTMPTGTTHIRFVLDGALAAGQSAYLEVRSATIISVSGSIPQVAVRTAQQTYHAVFSINNVTTGDSMSFNIPIIAGKLLAVDTDTRNITMNGVRVMASPMLSSKRGTWLYLVDGANTLTFTTQQNGGRISGSIAWQDRSI